MSISLMAAQDNLYRTLNDFSETHEIMGRFCSIPVAILDVTLDVLQLPVEAIKSVFDAGMKLLSFPTSKPLKGRLLKLALYDMQRAFGAIANIPVRLAVAPFKIIFQVVVIIIDPKTVLSINEFDQIFRNVKNH